MEWIVIVLLVANLALVAFLLLRKVEVKDNNQSIMMLQNQMAELSRGMEHKLSEGTKSMSTFMTTQSDQAQRLMSSITKQVSDQLIEVVKGVTETKESTKQVFTIAEQLQNLEKVLKNQKQRGNLGEASLELVLSNVLPPGQFQTQYEFKDGTKADVVIKTAEGMISVDAKFPLENYIRLTDEIDDVRREQYRKDFRSDVKKRIDETAKYIKINEDTMPFAFMFIPSEAIYYDLLNNDVGVGINSRDLIEYAYKEKHVIIASPTTFLAYLQTVLFGNQRMKIQETAKDIIKNVNDLGKHLNAYQESHNKVGKLLGQTVSNYMLSNKAFKLIDKDVVRISQESIGLNLEVIETPLLDTSELE